VERAIAFERDNLMLAAGSVEEAPFGRWMRNPDHPQMWSMNQLYVDGPQPGLTAQALTAELDRGLADARHRRAIVTHDGTGRALAEPMAAGGYTAVGLMVMLLDREPPAPAPGLAREIDEAQMRALEARLVADSGSIPERDREVVLAGHAHLRGSIPGTRMFAGLDGDEPVAQLTLYARDGIAQPEDIETAAAHQGKGIGAAVTALATREAVAAGHEVFILCHAADGPFPLYAALGFRAAGRFWTFTRPG
jgi:GNAT superfamily N-acetyltransferase